MTSHVLADLLKVDESNVRAKSPVIPAAIESIAAREVSPVRFGLDYPARDLTPSGFASSMTLQISYNILTIVAVPDFLN